MADDYRRTPEGFIDLDYEMPHLHAGMAVSLILGIGIGTPVALGIVAALAWRDGLLLSILCGDPVGTLAWGTMAVAVFRFVQLVIPAGGGRN